MYFVPCAKIKSSQVIKSNHFIIYLNHPLTLRLPINFTIENISNATISSLADLLALLFVREEISSNFKRHLILLFISKFKSYYLVYFYYYLWASLHFLVRFIGHIVLFHLTFPFIYSIFNKNFQFQQNKQILKRQ